MRRLAIISTHPIQYNAPLFKLLAERKIIEICVFYTFSQSQKGNQFDINFGRVITWDLPLLEGYNYSFVENIARNPGTYHFSGVRNPTLINCVERWAPDFLLIYGWSFKSHLKCLTYFKNKIPILFRGDSTLLGESPGLRKLIRRIFLKWVYRHVDIALYVGTQNKLYYLANSLKQEQLVFAPHAIENVRFDDFDGKLAQLALVHRRKIGIKDDDFVFLYAGKMYDVKNIELLINAFKKIGSPNSKLLIVGSGSEEGKLKSLASDDGRILFQTFRNQTEMPWVYRMGNVFVLPSKSETWGLSINEAMATERAVIVSDKCGCAVDLVMDGRNGFVFESNNNEDLLEKMKIMMTGKKWIEAGAESKIVIESWTIEKTCDQIEKIVLEK